MPATDRTGDGLGAPAVNGFAVTPSDSADFAFATRAIYVGGAGTVVAVLFPSGAVLTFVGATAGSILPVRASRVNSTGTTATSLLGLF